MLLKNNPNPDNTVFLKCYICEKIAVDITFFGVWNSKYVLISIGCRFVLPLMAKVYSIGQN